MLQAKHSQLQLFNEGLKEYPCLKVELFVMHWVFQIWDSKALLIASCYAAVNCWCGKTTNYFAFKEVYIKKKWQEVVLFHLIQLRQIKIVSDCSYKFNVSILLCDDWKTGYDASPKLMCPREAHSAKIVGTRLTHFNVSLWAPYCWTSKRMMKKDTVSQRGLGSKHAMCW